MQLIESYLERPGGIAHLQNLKSYGAEESAEGYTSKTTRVNTNSKGIHYVSLPNLISRREASQDNP